jgi:hypothetical protein
MTLLWNCHRCGDIIDKHKPASACFCDLCRRWFCVGCAKNDHWFACKETWVHHEEAAVITRRTIDVPGVVVVSEANVRTHWAARKRRFDAQAFGVVVAWNNAGLPKGIGADKLAITLTRVGGRALDTDNLAGAFKGVRDQLARLLLVDDADPRVTWHYAQCPGGRSSTGIRVTLEHTA